MLHPDMLNKNPWDLHSDLTQERLTWIARTFASIRRDARGTHEPKKGDRMWGYGCKCYERQMHAIMSAAGTEDCPWLGLVNPSMKFVFSIGAVHARFYKGKPETPRENLREKFDELRQCSLFAIDDPSSFAWCFAVEADADGLVNRITLAAFGGDDQPVYTYDIPFEGSEQVMTPIAPIVRLPLPEPVHMEAPIVAAPSNLKKIISGKDEES